jgi:glycosyltransferase involved in cell wall biosynthesis
MKQQLIFFVQDKIGGVTVLMHNVAVACNGVFDTSIVYLRDNSWIIDEASQFCPVQDFTRESISYFDKRKYLLRSIGKHVPGPEAILIANDGLELEAVNFLRLPNRVVYTLHGDYDLYYDTAVQYEGVINKFIVVSENIRQSLAAKLPQRKNDIVYLKHIVPDATETRKSVGGFLRILFIGRLAEEKGFFDLIEIDKKLKQAGVQVEWTVVGDGVHTGTEWLNNDNVHWIRKISNEALRNELARFDIFILPSRAEGFPVSLLETMKAGVVPLITGLPGAIDEVVENGVTGFKYPIGAVDDYVRQLIVLNQDRSLLNELSQNAFRTAHERFGAADSVKQYIEFFSHIPFAERRFLPVHQQQSWLESDMVPNKVTKTIRGVKTILNGIRQKHRN